MRISEDVVEALGVFEIENEKDAGQREKGARDYRRDPLPEQALLGEPSGDERLDGVLAEIELRVEVELAKMDSKTAR